MNSMRYLPTKTSKFSKSDKKPTKKKKVSKKKLPVYSIQESLNLTEGSIEPLNQTFTFQPNQDSEEEESEVQFIATQISYIQEQLTQDMEMEIYQTLKKRQSKGLSIKQQKISLENYISNDQQGYEPIKKHKQFKNTKNFQKSQDFINKNKPNTSNQQPSSTSPKKLKSKLSNILQVKKNIKPIFAESQKQIFAPQKTQEIEPKANPVDSQNLAKKLESSSRPTKKLKTNTSIKSRPSVKFSVDIKLLNNKENITKVMRFSNSDQIEKNSEALYLVEVESSKEQKVLNHLEMTHFYKHALIQFYQGIIFD